MPEKKATATAAYPEIKAANQLLSLAKFNELEPTEQAAYTEAANVFVDAFNSKYPQGKVVKVKILQIRASENRVTFVVEPSPNLSSTAYSFPYNVVDAISANLGAGRAEGLISLHHASLEPLQLKMTVSAVKEGDEYEAGDDVKEYKCPAMVRTPGTREEIELSSDAKDIISQIQLEVLKEQAKISSGRGRSQTTTPARVVVATPAGDVDDNEADV